MQKLNIGAKIKKQMSKRGWTEEMLELVYLNLINTELTRDKRYNIGLREKMILLLSITAMMVHILSVIISQVMLSLIKDIQREPFSGIGKPEPLKYELQGYWSRRITDEHRLVYKVEENLLIIISCKYHYD
jgi:toxin YoeB